MPYLTLLAGLALPWMGGYLWLVNVESFFRDAPGSNRLRSAGYGFFLGCGILYAVILANSLLAGSVSYSVVMFSLLAVVGTGGLLLYARQQAGRGQDHPGLTVSTINKYSWAEKALLLILMLWIVTHLLFAAVELLSTPVYPWDAWLVWVYRAKAWFYAGNVLDLVSASDWIGSSEPATYTINAYSYPRFASVIPFWAAVSLGYWSETLINIPVLLCGIAMGLALYGQCRTFGLGAIWALVICYFLFSTPILGVHLTLAGYADIWMAGFVGLGFVALVHGLIVENRLQLLLGLSMVALGILVKNEGVVCFYAVLLLLFVATVRPRVSLTLLGVIALTTVAAAFFGRSYVEIPLIGGLGTIDNRLSLPFIDTFSLEFHNVFSAFFKNFFALGSWNLLWVLLFSSLVIAAIPPYDKAKRVALLFLLIFMTTHIFIFVFTEQGRWAIAYTAINRLPLQFLPALLFSMAIITRSAFTGRKMMDEVRHE